MTPLWKRLQPPSQKAQAINPSSSKQNEPKGKTGSQMMEEQDRQTEIYRQCGIVEGCIGSLQESDLRDTMTRILSQPGLSGNERYDLLDALWFQGVNNMEFFRISDVEEEIRAAQTTVLNQK